jgi:hypothetical protein
MLGRTKKSISMVGGNRGVSANRMVGGNRGVSVNRIPGSNRGVSAKIAVLR